MIDVRLIAFTRKGLMLANSICTTLAERGYMASCSKGFGDDKVYHRTWAEKAFKVADALIFVGATGIAVRSIAPLLESKATDPAVITIDENAHFCIPLISGHIGGANLLAKEIAQITGAAYAVTTASDVNGIFAVDSWATQQGMLVENIPMIKHVTSKLLEGETVTYASEIEIEGARPKGVCVAQDYSEVDFHVGIHLMDRTLNLIPRCAIVGIGCRKGTERKQIEDAFNKFLKQNRISQNAIFKIASIDLKAQEEGLVSFCESRGFEFETFSADELNALDGSFTSSEFVSSVTGTDSVCERSCVAAGASLEIGKTIIDSITFALGVVECKLTWEESK